MDSKTWINAPDDMRRVIELETADTVLAECRGDARLALSSMVRLNFELTTALNRVGAVVTRNGVRWAGC